MPRERGSRPERTRAVVAAVALLLAGMSAVPADARPLDPTTPPPGLPAHLGVGLAAHPDSSGIYGWMPDRGIPWDYAYQYLAGGVNTGYGWSTWNENARFPLWYAQGATAASYIPVFPYYMLLQSKGPCDGCGEAEQDLAHLNSPALMKRYLSDFALLMKRLGPGVHGGIRGFGGTAIVHVEPDLSGYAMQAVLDNDNCFGHCTGQGNNPGFLKAAVASSGHPLADGYPNTFRGFNLALLHIRDAFAPNVLLAAHLSNWAVLHDIGSSRDPALDPVGLGRKAGRFTALSGARPLRDDTSTYDLLFNDVADRDAGYYRYVHGRDVFWDRTNRTLPNFHRWEAYLGAATSVAGLPAMVWQIPLGNQYFRTVSNTDGHYQDNRVEYLFDHMEELRSIGVIGLLFGRGNAGSTTNTDDRGDGITNPAPLCTGDGMGGGEICNTHESTVADDDGGYLRMAAAAYYENPLPLT